MANQVYNMVGSTIVQGGGGGTVDTVPIVQSSMADNYESAKTKYSQYVSLLMKDSEGVWHKPEDYATNPFVKGKEIGLYIGKELFDFINPTTGDYVMLSFAPLYYSYVVDALESGNITSADDYVLGSCCFSIRFESDGSLTKHSYKLDDTKYNDVSWYYLNVVDVGIYISSGGSIRFLDSSGNEVDNPVFITAEQAESICSKLKTTTGSNSGKKILTVTNGIIVTIKTNNSDDNTCLPCYNYRGDLNLGLTGFMSNYTQLSE